MDRQGQNPASGTSATGGGGRHHLTGAYRTTVRGVLLALGVALVVVLAYRAAREAIDPTGPTSVAQLDCDREGYPCSLSEVPEAILLASDSVATSVVEGLAAGEPLDLALRAVRDRTDLVDLIALDGVAVFRLAGGRPTWVWTPEALASGTLGFGARPVAPPAALPNHVAVSDAPEHASRLAPPAHDHVAIVAPAERDSGDLAGTTAPRLTLRRPTETVGSARQNRRDKRALVLSPYAWQTPMSGDEGADVAGVLSGIRGYEGRVEYHANPPDPSHATMVWSQWTSWDRYDVVHVVTHGGRHCRNDSCFTTVMTGVHLNLFDVPHVTVPAGTDLAYFIHPIEHSGNPACKRSPTTRATIGKCTYAYRHLSLTNDFFRIQYPAGLDNTIVMFSACETAEDQSLADALSSATTVFLGWDAKVTKRAARSASVAFFARLGERGEPTERSYDALIEAGLHWDWDGEPNGRNAALTRRASGSDLRIRETIWLLNPDDGSEVVDRSSLNIDGVIDDGEDDRLPIKFRVDGIDPGKVRDYVPHLSVNGVEVREDFDLTKGRQINEVAWEVVDTASLWFDVKRGHRAHLEAWVELPEGGDTRVEVLDVELEDQCYWRGSMTGFEQRELEGNSVQVTWMEVEGRVGAQIALGHFPDTGEHPAMYFALWGPIAERSYDLGAMDGDGTLYFSTPQAPWQRENPDRPGRVTITLSKPDEMVVGGFAFEAGGMGGPEMEYVSHTVRGEFVWTPACPTWTDQLVDLGQRTSEWLERPNR